MMMDMDGILKKADEVLNKIRPHLKVDGGDIEVVSISDDYILKVKMLGNCGKCDMSILTLKAGVEQVIQQEIPEIISVVAI
jgi:Fe-S cluster biogenesis protein NfuA